MILLKKKTNCKRMTKVKNQIDKITKTSEIIMFFCYITLSGFIKAFHEPWFDEAQAWMISKSVSIIDIITLIPHNEGHPPIWHLLLALFAKNGFPYEFSLNFITTVLSSIIVFFIIFKSPFPKFFRIALPFTFFVFYQYGVISRTYSLMLLGFVVLAMFEKSRNEKPFRYIAALCLICVSSAYGIVFCMGIVIVWLIQMIKSNLRSKIIHDKRIHGLLVLLIINVFIVYTIIPNNNASAIRLIPTNSFIQRFLYMVIIAPIDSLIYSSNTDYGRLIWQDSWTFSYSIGLAIGIVFMFFLIFHAFENRMVLKLSIPYLMFSLFAALVYFYTHHVGIVAIYLLYYFWIVEETTKGRTTDFVKFSKNRIISQKDKELILKTFTVFITVGIVISISWTIISSYNEIFNNYGFGREMAKFIKTYDLEESIIICSWKDNPSYLSMDPVDTNVILAIDILPYFGSNIISNLNQGRKDLGYLLAKVASEKENYENIRLWRSNGIPDIIIGRAKNFDTVFEGIAKFHNYILVKQFERSYIWKDTIQIGYVNLYIKKQLAYNLGLEEVIPIDEIVVRSISKTIK